MLNYLNNNLVLIKEYQSLYSNEISIDNIISKFKTGEIILHNGFDYGRFQVFIDSCLLLFNIKKLNHYYENGYSFNEFVREVKNKSYLKEYFEFIKNAPLTGNISDICLYHSLENKKKNP